jgi:transmembrane sensor
MASRIETLFQKLIDGSCSRQEYDELMDLLKENQHEEKVRSMLSQVYQLTARSIPSGTYVDTNGDLQTTGSPLVVDMQPRKRSYLLLPGSVAAMLLLTLGAWWMFQQNTDTKTGKNAITGTVVKKATQAAEQKYLLLPDSTQVWLNVASTLEFSETFQTNKREVYLTGEAFFDVKHADNMPFIIHTGNVATTVLGTAFNIKAYPGQPDVVVAVKRGKVQVSRNHKTMATLTKGQQVTVIATSEEGVIENKKESAVADWTAGQLSYTSRPLFDILHDLERNYNVTIALNDNSLQQEIVTTSFRRDIGVKQALDILCGLTNSQLAMKNGKYIISR